MPLGRLSNKSPADRNLLSLSQTTGCESGSSILFSIRLLATLLHCLMWQQDLYSKNSCCCTVTPTSDFSLLFASIIDYWANATLRFAAFMDRKWGIIYAINKIVHCKLYGTKVLLVFLKCLVFIKSWKNAIKL